MKKILAMLALTLILGAGVQACEEKKPERTVSIETLETARHQLFYRNLARHSMRESVRSKMAALPRHDLVGNEMLGRVYLDVPLQPEGGPWLWPPSQLALVLTLLDPQPGRRALLMGAQEGWAAMILASMGVETHIWEPSAEWAEQVRGNLSAVAAEEFDPKSIQWFETAGEAMGAGPWDYIFVTGTVQNVPGSWTSSLRAGSGILIAPYGTPPAVQLASFTSMGGRVVEQQILRGNFPYLMINPTLNYAALYPSAAPAEAPVPEEETAAGMPAEPAMEEPAAPEGASEPGSDAAEQTAASALEEAAAAETAPAASEPEFQEPSESEEASSPPAEPMSQTPEPVPDEATQEGSAQ